jgi:hypothetical protein
MQAKPAEPIRVPAALIFAAAIHIIPMLYLIMPAPVMPPEEPETVSIDLNELPELATNPATAKPEQNSKTVTLDSAAQPNVVVIPPKTPAAPSPATPPRPAVPLPPPPEAAGKLAAPKEEKTADKLALAPMNKENEVAFDDSKVTTPPPEHGYASDRNSTAADRGPKNLPKGDPYNKNGQTSIQKTLGISGEGDLPPITSTPTAGSVKVEGSPDTGKGLKSETPDKEIPLASAKPSDKPAMASKPLPVVDVATKTKDAVAAPELAETISPKTKDKIAGAERTTDGSLPVGEKVVKGPEKKATGLARKADAEPEPLSTIQTPESTFSTPATDKKDELADFAALLDDTARGSGVGGTTGDKSGAQRRQGKIGHEGDGTFKPGDQNAVSELVIFNVTTSAEGVGEPRFAKRLDPIAAYFRPIVRRVDAKWRALVAAERTRVVTGSVTIHIVMHKSGKLIEAKIEEQTEGLPDKYAFFVKDAVQQATSPSAEPFAGELSKSDRADMYVRFFY